MVYPALLPLMRTPRLRVVDWTDAPRPILNGLVRFAERRNVFCVCAITFQLASTTGVALLVQQCKVSINVHPTRAGNRVRLSAKQTSTFKSAGASVHSTTGSRGVRISCSNAGYTVFRGSVKSTGYPFHSPFSPSIPLPCVTVCISHFNWTLPLE